MGGTTPGIRTKGAKAVFTGLSTLASVGAVRQGQIVGPTGAESEPRDGPLDSAADDRRLRRVTGPAVTSHSPGLMPDTRVVTETGPLAWDDVVHGFLLSESVATLRLTRAANAAPRKADRRGVRLALITPRVKPVRGDQDLLLSAGEPSFSCRMG
jgi:hypothetical protein